MKKLMNTRVVLFALTVALFVIGAGAPEASGGVIFACRTFLGF
jgi:hypothetical protein